MDDTAVYTISPIETPILRGGPEPTDEQLTAWRKECIESSRKWYADCATVGELIEELSKFPVDWKVAVDDDGRLCRTYLSADIYTAKGESIGQLVTLNG